MKLVPAMEQPPIKGAGLANGRRFQVNLRTLSSVNIISTILFLAQINSSEFRRSPLYIHSPSHPSFSPSSGSSCSKQAQSPIAVPQTQIDPTLLPPIFTELNGGCSKVNAGANDHVYEIDFGVCKNATLSFNGDSSYQLMQFHFHSPSEHTIGGSKMQPA